MTSHSGCQRRQNLESWIWETREERASLWVCQFSQLRLWREAITSFRAWHIRFKSPKNRPLPRRLLQDQVFHSFDLMIKVANALFVLSPECRAEALQTIQEIIAASNHAISTHGPQRRRERPNPLTHRRWPLFAQSTLAKQEPQCLPASRTKSAPPRFGPSEAPALDLGCLEGDEITKQPTELRQQRSPFARPRRPPRRDSAPHPSPAQACPACPTRGLSPRRAVQFAYRPDLRLRAEEEAACSHADHEGVGQEDAPIVHEDLYEVVEPRIPNPGKQVVVLRKEAVPPVVDPTQVGESVVNKAIGCGPTAAEGQEEQEQESLAPLPGSSSPGAPVGGPLMRPMVPWLEKIWRITGCRALVIP